MQQIVTVKAVIKLDDKILLLRRSKHNNQYQGLYELPGGKVSFGEDPNESLRREILEEIQCQVQTAQLAEVVSSVDSTNKMHYITLIFWVAVSGINKIVLSNEHDKYSWKKMSDLQPNELTDFTRLQLGLEEKISETDIEMIKNSHNDVNNATKSEQVIVYTDGGSRGNPGPSASGFVIKDASEHILFEGGKYLGITTNNQAEYQAVKLALEKAIELGAQYIQCRMDSQLVVNQLTGVYQIRNRDLWPVHAAIKELVLQCRRVTFTHVRREFNKEADAMVNKILDAQMKK